MRILMLAPSLNIQGPIPKHTPVLLRELQALGCQMTLETWGRHKDQETIWEKSVGRASDILRLRRRLARERFDLMVVRTAHDWSTLSRDLLLLLATRRLCNPIVLQFHGSSSDCLVQPGHTLFKRLTSIVLGLCDAAMVLSSQEQREWGSFYPGLKFHTVCNPFEAPKVSVPRRDHERQRLFHLDTDIPVLLFVGRLVRPKGVFELLDALALIIDKRPCHLVLAGDGPERGQVLQQIRDLRLQSHVTLTGYLKGDDIYKVYHCADIFVLPSWAEGLSFALLEAMNAGLPVITTGIRGMADHLTDGVNGLFVPLKNPGVLAEKIAYLLDHEGLRTQMRLANQKKIEQFAPEAVGKHYLSVLREVVGRAERGSSQNEH